MLNKKFLYEVCRLHKPGETEITKVKNSVKKSKLDATYLLKKKPKRHEIDIEFILGFYFTAIVK